MTLPTMKKMMLGGMDRHAILKALSENGETVATQRLQEQRENIISAGTNIDKDSVVLILGGSNGITRALAIQMLFGENANVAGIYYDSERFQIGHYHVDAMTKLANQEGKWVQFWNADALKEENMDKVIEVIKSKFRYVHLINGIAAGSPKRYAKYGPTQVREVDVAFDPVLQVPDFSVQENIRKLGLVDVEIATEADIERTLKFMGTSTKVWAEKLIQHNLLTSESVVTFCDYDFEPDDPIYALGPLADSKREQRKSLDELRTKLGCTVVRFCYPPMATTALGAIPGGCLMYGLSTQILMERGEFKDIPTLAFESMAPWKQGWNGDSLHVDQSYQEILPAFHRRKILLQPGDEKTIFSLLIEK